MWARCRVIHLLLVRLWFFIWQHLQILFCYVSRLHFLGKVYLPSGRTRKYQKCTAGCSISVYAVWHFHNLFSRLIVLFRFAKSGRSRLLLTLYKGFVDVCTVLLNQYYYQLLQRFHREGNGISLKIHLPPDLEMNLRSFEQVRKDARLRRGINAVMRYIRLYLECGRECHQKVISLPYYFVQDYLVKLKSHR